jgi:hypothetical protein
VAGKISVWMIGVSVDDFDLPESDTAALTWVGIADVRHGRKGGSKVNSDNEMPRIGHSISVRVWHQSIGVHDTVV